MDYPVRTPVRHRSHSVSDLMVYGELELYPLELYPLEFYPLELAARLAADSRADSGSQPSCDQMILPEAETRTNQGWS